MTRLALFIWLVAGAHSRTELRHGSWTRETGRVPGDDDPHVAERPPLASDIPNNPDCSKCDLYGADGNCCLPYPPSRMPSPKCSVTLPKTLKNHPKWPKEVPRDETWNSFTTTSCQIPDGELGIRGSSGVTCDPCWLTGASVMDEGMLYCEQPIPDRTMKGASNTTTGKKELAVTNHTEHVVCFNATPRGARFVCNAGDPQLDIYGGWTLGEGEWLPQSVPDYERTLQALPHCPKALQAAQAAQDEQYRAQLKKVTSARAKKAEEATKVQGTAHDKVGRIKAADSRNIAIEIKADIPASLLEFYDARRRPAPSASRETMPQF